MRHARRSAGLACATAILMGCGLLPGNGVWLPVRNDSGNPVTVGITVVGNHDRSLIPPVTLAAGEERVILLNAAVEDWEFRVIGSSAHFSADVLRQLSDEYDRGENSEFFVTIHKGNQLVNHDGP